MLTMKSVKLYYFCFDSSLVMPAAANPFVMISEYYSQKISLAM